MDEHSIKSSASDQTSTKLTKLDILIINQGWNNKNEKLVVGIGYNAGLYKDLHDKAAVRFDFYDKIINYLIIILSVFLSTNGIIQFINDNGIIVIVTRIIYFIITLLTVSNNFLKCQSRASKHKYSSSEFYKIYNDVRNTMTIYKKDRRPAVEYIQNIMKQYDQLEISSPEIPAGILRKMSQKLKLNKNKNLKMPNDNTQEIEVVVDVPNCFEINNRQNLKNIQECWGVNGDMSENDNITLEDVNQAKKAGLNIRTKYEFDRMTNMQ